MVSQLFSKSIIEEKEIEIHPDSDQFSSELKRQESEDEIIEGTGLKLTNLEIEDPMGLDNSRAHDFDNSFIKVVEFDDNLMEDER